MTITIRPIKKASDIFDVNRSQGTFFWKKNEKSILMTAEEQKAFRATNFVVGYAGKDPRLSSWCHTTSKGLSNINVDMQTSDLRQYLWHLVNCEFSSDGLRPALLRKLRVAEGYYILRELQSIAETSKNHDITLWTLSSYDKENAELLKRFLTYLANK